MPDVDRLVDQDDQMAQIEPAAAVPPVPRRRLVPADGLLVLAIMVIPAVVLVFQPSITNKSLTIPIAIGAAVAAAIVFVRRWWPVPMLAVALVGTLVMMAATRDRTPLMVAVVVMLYTVASTTDDRRTGRWAGLVTMVLLFGATTILLGEPVLGPDALAVIAWTSLAVAAGEAVRSRRDYIVAMEDRARRAEESREQEARRRVAEERLRIARDVHDVVAHRMAVISVQAAAAAALLSVRPDEAAVAIETVRSSASTVLDELGGLLNVLRAGDASPLAPAPTLDDLDGLVESFDAAGVHVTREWSGPPRAVPDHLQVVVFRVVQEALTNAQRHGTDRASLRFVYHPDAIEIEVSNTVATSVPGAEGSGFGLIGMRERVEAIGGSVEAGPDGSGQFRLAVRLPIPPAVEP